MGDKLRQRKALLKSAKGAADKVCRGGAHGYEKRRQGKPQCTPCSHAATSCSHAAVRPPSSRCTHVPHPAMVCPSRSPAGPSLRQSLGRANPCPWVEPGASLPCVHPSITALMSKQSSIPPPLPVGWAVISRPLQPAAAPRRRRSRRQRQRDPADPCGAGAAGGEAGEEGEERCECVWGGPWEVGRSG